ncbi:hypothetical protein GCM10023205_74480 [Yinghuangia aomiensis]|uniref:TPM domain-containing protein n=1 Tax=Yinghuangia aomiensis TaxID=676205 RepID=A0ABP9I9R1_9ACTN
MTKSAFRPFVPPARSVFVLVLLLALAMLPLSAGRAQAAAGVSEIAASLRADPVYADPAASDVLPATTANALRATIHDSGKPVFVVAVPADSPLASSSRADVLSALRQQVGHPGVYAVAVGRVFDAASDASVLTHERLATLKSDALAAHQGDGPGLFTQFVDGAVHDANAHGASGSAGSTGTASSNRHGSAVALAVFGLVVLGGVGGALWLRRRGRQRRTEREQAELAQVRPTVDEDITAYGELLDRTAFDPAAADADDAMRDDWTQALDAYDRAKTAMRNARRPDDVRAVGEALDAGRFALATLAARRAGEPLPQRRPPCFFDPRHGASVRDTAWTPSGGTPRTVPVCAADAARLDDGLEPEGRQVETPSGRRPYWEAGPAYAPWAMGWYGGGLLPGLLIGTMLGSATAPAAYAGPDGGDTYGGWGDGGAGGMGGFGGWGGDGGGGWGGGDGGGGGF